MHSELFNRLGRANAFRANAIFVASHSKTVPICSNTVPMCPDTVPVCSDVVMICGSIVTMCSNVVRVAIDVTWNIQDDIGAIGTLKCVKK